MDRQKYVNEFYYRCFMDDIKIDPPSDDVSEKIKKYSATYPNLDDESWEKVLEQMRIYYSQPGGMAKRKENYYKLQRDPIWQADKARRSAEEIERSLQEKAKKRRAQLKKDLKVLFSDALKDFVNRLIFWWK